MTKFNTRKPLIALIALSAAAAMPLALAQEKAEDAAQAQQQTEQAAEPAQQAAGSAEQSAQQSTQSASQGQQGWAEIDKDGDGSITKEEAAANAGLSQVFDQADADTDGKLTADEYKAFVEKNYNEPQK